MTKEFNLSEKFDEIIKQRKKLHDRNTFDLMEYLIEFEISKHVKEFIKIVEDIIIRRYSRRIQLLRLKKAAGEKLI